MKIANDQVLLGARVSSALKKKLTKFCVKEGVRMNFFVAQAIEEKLEDALSAEDWEDVRVARKEFKEGKTKAWRSLKRG
jgi:hypothetical protein